MNIVFQLLLATCLVAGLYATGDNVNDALDASFYGLEESVRGTVEDTEQNNEIDEETTTVPSSPSSRWNKNRGTGHREHHGRRHGSQHGGGWNHGNWTDEQKINHICRVMSSPSSSSRSRHASKMNRLSPETREQINNVLAPRKAAMEACCKLTGSERVSCVDDIKRARYERVCNNEEPLCIWAAMKRQQSSERQTASTEIKDRCCALQDQERFTCFGEARGNYQHRQQSRRSRN